MRIWMRTEILVHYLILSEYFLRSVNKCSRLLFEAVKMSFKFTVLAEAVILKKIIMKFFAYFSLFCHLIVVENRTKKFSKEAKFANIIIIYICYSVTNA